METERQSRLFPPAYYCDASEQLNTLLSPTYCRTNLLACLVQSNQSSIFSSMPLRNSSYIFAGKTASKKIDEAKK